MSDEIPGDNDGEQSAPTSRVGVDADVIPLVRYGLKWNGPQNFITTEMPDGYWTPWHVANDELSAARKRANYWKSEHLAGNAEIVKLRTALEKIASRSQDTHLLWWQKEARKALEV